MRFSVLAFAPLALAAVIPRQASDKGSWAVTLSISSAANGFQSRDLTAVYSSTDIAEPTTTTCKYSYTPSDSGPTVVDECSDASFSYYYFGSTVGVTQTINSVTLSGEDELSQTCNGSGRSCTIEGTVTASQGVA